MPAIILLGVPGTRCHGERGGQKLWQNQVLIVILIEMEDPSPLKYEILHFEHNDSYLAKRVLN